MSADLFSIDGMTLLCFAAMGAVTFAMRAGGFWLMSRVALTERLRRGLEALPGAIIVSTILPVALAKGVPASACLLAAALVMAVVKRDSIAVAAALASAAALRQYGF